MGSEVNDVVYLSIHLSIVTIMRPRGLSIAM